MPTPRPGTLSLDQFLALSALLTGFENLSPVLGSLYLGSLESRAAPEATLADIYTRAGLAAATLPASLDDLARAGLFEDSALRSLADTIIEYWYTGIYGSGENQTVATYVDALVWQAMTFTKPGTICGPFEGFWREPPPVLP